LSYNPRVTQFFAPSTHFFKTSIQQITRHLMIRAVVVRAFRRAFPHHRRGAFVERPGFCRKGFADAWKGFGFELNLRTDQRLHDAPRHRDDLERHRAG
jgi:hypothetical protein